MMVALDAGGRKEGSSARCTGSRGGASGWITGRSTGATTAPGVGGGTACAQTDCVTTSAASAAAIGTTPHFRTSRDILVFLLFLAAFFLA